MVDVVRRHLSRQARRLSLYPLSIMHSPFRYVPGCVVEYCGATNARGSVWRATLTRGNAPGDRFRAVVPYADGPDAAARAVVERFNAAMDASWQLIGAALSITGGDRYAYPVGPVELVSIVSLIP
jgi:hypothetical protein